MKAEQAIFVFWVMFVSVTLFVGPVPLLRGAVNVIAHLSNVLR